MFRSSARSVLASMEMLSDEVSMLEKKVPKEPPYQSLLEAIQRSDAAMTVAQPDKPRGDFHFIASFRYVFPRGTGT